MRAARQRTALPDRAALARPWVRYGGLFVFAAALSGCTILKGINPHDEGLMLQAAGRIADGQLPYRDFWWNYGPGQPLALAGLQELFGPSLLAWRVLRVMIDATASVLAYALARRDGARELPALAAGAAVAAAMAFPRIPNPGPTIVALGLGAMLLAPRTPFWGGAAGGLTVAFRPDLGLAAATGAVIAATGAGGARRAAALRATAGALAGAVLSLGPFVVAGGPGRFWDQTFGFGLEQQDLQRLPLPGTDFLFPYVLLAGAALWLVAAVLERPPLAALAPVPLAAAGVLYLLARVDDFHLVPLAAVLPPMLAAAIGWERRARRPLGIALLAVPLALILLHGLDEKRAQAFEGPPFAPIRVNVADGVRAERRESRSLTAVVRLVRSRLAPGRPVFVANPRHDLVHAGNPLLYVLVQRPNPTRYDVMQPGIVTAAPVQREMVGDLRRARPEIVVRWLSPLADEREPNGAGRSSGVRILDRYLARAYRRERRIGDYAIFGRCGRC